MSRAYITHSAKLRPVDSTEPDDNDNDDDGYWDGWIGVYDVGRTDNVVLYLENARTGGGVQGNEIVQQQIETHSWEGREHSKVHVGELQWGRDPTDEDDTPDPTVRLEIDYEESSHQALQNASWRQSIVDNYALYGVDVEFVDDRYTDVVNQSDLTGCKRGAFGICVESFNYTAPFTRDDLYGVRDEFHDTDALYFFVGTVADDPNEPLLHPGQSGVRWYSGGRDGTDWIAVFTNGNTQATDFREIPAGRWGLTTDEQVQAISLKTTVHEIGHVLNAGEGDDIGSDEVYSGCSATDCINDPTYEYVNDKDQNTNVKEWGVMSRGTKTDQYLPPTRYEYFAFSIEELSTIGTGDVQVEE